MGPVQQSDAATPGWSRPTIADVAREADVSSTTVSLVLSGKAERISGVTRERVIRTAESLGYRPNRAAQGLRGGRSGTLGLLTDYIATQPYSGPILAGVTDVAWERRQRVHLINTTLDEERLAAGIEDLLSEQVDAIVFAAMGTSALTPPERIYRVPTVFLNAFPVGHEAPVYLPDERSGGRAAAQHLLDLGHTRIAMLAGSSDAWATGIRVTSFREALRDAGLDADAAPIRYGSYRLDTGYALTLEVMNEASPPTALLCGNDQMATGAYLALARLGLRIPEDVSLVGYDDEPTAALLTPPLTTVQLPFYEMGRLGAEAILAGTLQNTSRWLDCPLVLRGSTSPPASRA